jgi:predicted Zn-dependent protease with MMP-like domain
MADSELNRLRHRLPAAIQAGSATCRCDIVLMADCVAAGEMLEPDLLGLFEGLSRGQGEPEGIVDMPRIRLFLDNLWAAAGGDSRRFRSEVRITYLHELGHYLGLDEEAVAKLGLA